MPFLFVDYDPGTGGEFFCAQLSKSAECNTLEHELGAAHRTKVKDMFNQEFLKLHPKPQIKTSNPDLYDIVPTHRHTELARRLLPDVHAIRIQNPRDPELWKFVVEQRVKKTLLAHEPNEQYFLGFLKICAAQSGNKNFLRHVKKHHDNLDILLLSQGKDPNVKNRHAYLASCRSWSPREEPREDLYNVVLPYEDLVNDPMAVCCRLENKLEITVETSWMMQYQHNYADFLAST